MTPMDRDYGSPTAEEPSTNDAGIGVGDIGMSVPMGIAAQNVQGVDAKMRAGANALEIQFPGAQRGQRNAQTPGLFGKDQRQAMKELANINEVNLTTHASFGVMGLAGMDQQGNFSADQRKMAIDEVRRAVEFAADAAEGGSVVVHTGEFQRPISEQPWAKNPDGSHKFKAHRKEDKDAVIRVVDDRTGQVVQQVRKGQTVPRPVWLRAKDDHEWTDTKTGNRYHINQGDYIDYEGNKIQAREDRVPEYDHDSGRFKVELQDWKSFTQEAEEQNREEAKRKGMTIEQFKIKYPEKYIYPEEAFLKATLETNRANSKGWALYYSDQYERAVDTLKKLRKAKKFYEDLEKGTPESERWKLTREYKTDLERYGLIPKEHELPTKIIDGQIKDMERTIEQSREASSSQEAQARDAEETMTHIQSSEKYALNQSFRSYAEAGIHAYDQTNEKHLKNPLAVTMENIFPESYGSHPDELKELVLNSREEMARLLHDERGVPLDEAKKYAKEHLKATLDTGHVNTWRKYWQNDPNKNMKQNDDDFKKWILKKTEDLAKTDIIGNVHLADNFGYQDDHLAPGQGSTPVKEMVEILKKHGYKGALTVEPGADASTDMSDFHGLMKTWQLFGSPVYGAHGPVGRTDVPKGNWGDIQYSYFGQNKPPYFVFGSYSPSQDWSLWTQTPME